jgi:GR25 family glycosyltransferase involved in LPS biosynthesis
MQFIIISLTEERKNKTIELLNIINLNNYPIHFISASTIENSQDFLPENSYLNENILKIICCTKSHLRSIEYACSDTSSEYSIILEDDVTFHNNFNKNIQELIYNWENNDLYSNIAMINIGWVPCNNYNHYYNSEFKPFDELSTCKLFNYFYAVGLQGYIIKKSKITEEIKYIISSDTFFDYSLKVFDKIPTLLDKNRPSNSIYAIDNVLNKLLNFAVVFPPLIIERNEPSTLGHNNKCDYWDNYFKNNEEKINNYLKK